MESRKYENWFAQCEHGDTSIKDRSLSTLSASKSCHLVHMDNGLSFTEPKHPTKSFSEYRSFAEKARSAEWLGSNSIRRCRFRTDVLRALDNVIADRTPLGQTQHSHRHRARPLGALVDASLKCDPMYPMYRFASPETYMQGLNWRGTMLKEKVEACISQHGRERVQVEEPHVSLKRQRV